jgi:hypothetical protein
MVHARRTVSGVTAWGVTSARTTSVVVLPMSMPPTIITVARAARLSLA